MGSLSDTGRIARRARAARERLGWTREALAFHAGLSWSAIAQVESGRRTDLRASTLAALSRPLTVSIDYLVEGTRSRSLLAHSDFHYSTDGQFQTAMGSFLAEGSQGSEAGFAVTSAANIELLREHLGERARSVDFLDSSRFFKTPIAAVEAYRAMFEGALERGADWVRVVGEPVWAGRSDAEVRLWTRYESVLNLVFAAWPVTFVCAYDERVVAPSIAQAAHLAHPTTLGERGISANPVCTDPARAALEADTA
jgi:transcriptional regulator with XRE-family HTH domain